VGVAVAAFGFYTDALGLVPRVSVVPSEALNLDEAFSVPFTITNNGQFAIYDVRPGCRINLIEFGNENIMRRSFTIAQIDRAPILRSDDATTVLCRPLTKLNDRTTKSADIEITAEFSTWWRTRHVRSSRFVGARDSAGHIRWIRRPLQPVSPR
jgi:hypothetical protein